MAVNEGKQLPKTAKRPELCPGLDIYLDAFFILSNDRKVEGEYIGTIPRTSIRDYALDYGFDFEQTEALYFHIARLDSIFISYVKTHHG